MATRTSLDSPRIGEDDGCVSAAQQKLGEDEDLEAQSVPRNRGILSCFQAGWSLSGKSDPRLERFALSLLKENNSRKPTPLHLRFIEIFFGLSADDVSKWPGILVFLDHLERACFPQLLQPQFGTVWTLLGKDSPADPADCWHWCLEVVEVFQELHLKDDDPSLESAYLALLSRGTRNFDLSTQERDQVLQAIFSVLCWFSATLTPVCGDPKDTGKLAAAKPNETRKFPLSAENGGRIYSSGEFRRPASKMFYNFQTCETNGFGQSCCCGQPSSAADLHFQNSSSGMPGGRSDGNILYESSLNYFSLFKIGRVKLKWVDTITSHLIFERSTRTLSLFRFPSFCAMSIKKRENTTIEKLTAKLLPSRYYTDAVPEPGAVYREVLLSYRLLFGQSSASRKLLVQALTAKEMTVRHDQPRRMPEFQSTATNDEPESKPSETTDPLLLKCTLPIKKPGSRSFSLYRGGDQTTSFPSEIFPSSVLDLDGRVQDADSYSAREEFPIFGQRLLALQSYNLRQQPSKVTDFWRDRRNPLQWYTFWAVIWIGGASILVGLLQLFAAIIQTVATFKQGS
ncbi:hypothetical protein QQS21_006667 [Conoideocrella luteorostrata]|uniref:Uncharacterized protein n=1 Tax=Conoideocrella luteorostrata TaxID=1105319 RepID=A0AAJ0G017_9HYPO|nr:hypothetical protein QQS21_006667 [Conoideocrella luteorostrata]